MSVASTLPAMGRVAETEEPTVCWGEAAFLSWRWPCCGQRAEPHPCIGDLKDRGGEAGEQGEGGSQFTEGELWPWFQHRLTVRPEYSEQEMGSLCALPALPFQNLPAFRDL